MFSVKVDENIISLRCSSSLNLRVFYATHILNVPIIREFYVHLKLVPKEFYVSIICNVTVLLSPDVISSNQHQQVLCNLCLVVRRVITWSFDCGVTQEGVRPSQSFHKYNVLPHATTSTIIVWNALLFSWLIHGMMFNLVEIM